MNTIRRKLFSYIIFLLILAIFASIYTILIYYNKTSSEIDAFNKITFVLGIISFFILGFLTANCAGKHGLLEGLFSGLVVIIITLILNFFIRTPFISKAFIKIISYLSAASLGGVLGVNFRPIIKNKESN